MTGYRDPASNLDIFETIFAQIDAMIYQCMNDGDYTMSSIIGSPETISGYKAEDILGNRTVSWVGITHPDDKERVFSVVDQAIENNEAWDVDYRLIAPDGNENWVRERGCAVFKNGVVKYLQGMVVRADAEVSLRRDIETAAATVELEKREILRTVESILESLKSLSMLAINAQIEAAHSGAAGRGFSVIAEEIGRLAEENAVYAQQIANRTRADKPALAPLQPLPSTDGAQQSPATNDERVTV